MITVIDDTIVIHRPGLRIIPIQPLTDSMRFAALRAFGVRESVAAALTRGLVTIKEWKE